MSASWLSAEVKPVTKNTFCAPEMCLDVLAESMGGAKADEL